MNLDVDPCTAGGGAVDARRLRLLALVIPQLAFQVRSRRRLSSATHQSQGLAQLLLDGRGHLRMLLEVLLGMLPPLTDAVLLVRRPSPAFVHEPPLAREVQEIALTRDALAVHHVQTGHD
jgi:hypothetical protein